MFAGIGGFDEAFRRCGVRTVWAAESDPKCNSVRRRHFPDEQTTENVTAIRGTGFRADVITAGWPCQGNSVAGRRAGMADGRSGLWREVHRVLAEQRPVWFLGENVPGILSVNGGQDWLAVLGDLAELGYGTAYRILDAQWFGVPQRRRRVFVVGYIGDWRRAAAVLFERHSLSGHPAPRREARQDVAGTLSCGLGARGVPSSDEAASGHVVAREIARCVT
ncbi:MAG: DNA cytosine methyltransferase, partial [Planctomycetes bacterium]|nr:DNA cytosine methyltransferase [Planctomycetota bacterium]